jgi:predicted RNA methylase
MKCRLGDNGWGVVFPQGDVADAEKILALLKKAGGKPALRPLEDISLGGGGKAKPEFIITFNDDAHTIIVVECKNSVRKHRSENLDSPNGYAVDGALYYAKFLKESFNVVAVAISGTKPSEIKADAFYWGKGLASYDAALLRKAKDIILEPKNYIKLIKGEKLQKDYSLDEIRETAIEMHDYLREIAVREEHKPIFIAGVLIALSNDDFSKSYAHLPSYSAVMSAIQTAIENELKSGGIRSDRTAYIKQIFSMLQDNSKFSSIPLIQKKSITWYVEQLEMKIKPMMDYADSTLDALGVFYHEFIKYSGGDGSGLGIVLTPQHLTEFMVELAGVNKNSKVIDICCGSGGFLVTAMSKMFKDANPMEADAIRKERLYGVEQDDGLYTLAIANMIIRQDGKSNIIKGDCFDAEITKELKALNFHIGLINPPYSLKGGKVELEFAEQLLEILTVGGIGAVVVPVSCAIGTKYGDIRERLMKKHTLKAVFSMPDDIFYPTGTSPCVMVWQAHTSHDVEQETFFGYCKNDGFVKRKKLGRIDYRNEWPDILPEWLRLYRNRDVIDGLSARACVGHSDEWLCEAYMKTDYTLLSVSDFEKSVREFLAYQVYSGISDLSIKYEYTHQAPLPDTSIWREFALEDLFAFVKGRRLRKEDMSPGGTNYIGAISLNNGVRQSIDVEPIFKQNCITVNYNGSVGEAYYQIVPFWATDDVNVLYAKGWVLNKYLALFITTVIKANKFRFSYGRKWTMDKMKKSLIRLPATPQGSPDWECIEQFIKSLPYSDRI